MTPTIVITKWTMKVRTTWKVRNNTIPWKIIWTNLENVRTIRKFVEKKKQIEFHSRSIYRKYFPSSYIPQEIINGRYRWSIRLTKQTFIRKISFPVFFKLKIKFFISIVFSCFYSSSWKNWNWRFIFTVAPIKLFATKFAKWISNKSQRQRQKHVEQSQICSQSDAVAHFSFSSQWFTDRFELTFKSVAPM